MQKDTSLAKVVGQRLREARKEAGLTQKACSKLAGINNVTSYCYYEKGKRNIPLEYLVRISKVLDKPVAFFLNEETSERYPKKAFTNHQYEIENKVENYFTQMNPDHLFSTFYTDETNLHACILAKSAITSDWHHINSLYLYSTDRGTGKTHLLHSMGNAALHKKMRVVSKNGLFLSHEIAKSLKENTIQNLMEDLLSSDLLIIDDIDYLGKDDSIQSVFRRIIDDFCNAGKIIAMSSQKPPELLEHFDESTVDKIRSGPVVAIGTPNVLTWTNILRSKSIGLGWYLTEDIARTFASRLKMSGHLIQGIIQHYTALRKQYGRIPSKDIARYLVESENNRKGELRENIDPQEVLVKVSHYLEISVEDLGQKKRDRRSCLARQLATYLLREDFDLSFTAIGGLLGNRDHSTIIYSWKRVNEQISVDDEVNNMITAIRNSIYAY